MESAPIGGDSSPMQRQGFATNKECKAKMTSGRNSEVGGRE